MLLVLFLFVVISLLLAFLVRWHVKNYYYRCPECQEKIVLPFWKDFLSLNSLQQSKVKCPKCGYTGYMEEHQKKAVE